MEIAVMIDGHGYCLDTGKGLDISIPLEFGDGKQPRAFGAPAASQSVYKAGDFIGDVRQGGNVNCETYTITPHCNGTHTECAGHIAEQRIAVNDVLGDCFVPATLITVAPERAENCGESYEPAPRPDDLMLTRTAIKNALQGSETTFHTALVIRTAPNGNDKTTRNYDETTPPYFSAAAREFIASLNVMHLLVDMPSVDRLDDDGKLTNHHTYWNITQGSHDVESALPKTITELIYVRDEIKDGKYILGLQVAPFVADAAPSRPILYEVTNDL